VYGAKDDEFRRARPRVEEDANDRVVTQRNFAHTRGTAMTLMDKGLCDIDYWAWDRFWATRGDVDPARPHDRASADRYSGRAVKTRQRHARTWSLARLGEPLGRRGKQTLNPDINRTAAR
jgi:hypothetical protein